MMSANDISGCDGPKMMLSNGKYLDLLNPDPECFDIALIARSLSREYRYANQTPAPYSVAEHSFHCAHVYECLGGITYTKHIFLHDASEAVLKDIPRPIRMLLPNYKELEDRIQNAILQRFGLTAGPNSQSRIRWIDNIVLKAEIRTLFHSRVMPETLHEVADFPVLIPCYSSADAEKMFLNCADELGIT